MEYIKRMRDLREDRDKTQREIAQVLGTSQTMYARYERGANELPIRHLVTLWPGSGQPGFGAWKSPCLPGLGSCAKNS